MKNITKFLDKHAPIDIINIGYFGGSFDIDILSFVPKHDGRGVKSLIGLQIDRHKIVLKLFYFDVEFCHKKL